jgi:hypothetical protein
VSPCAQKSVMGCRCTPTKLANWSGFTDIFQTCPDLRLYQSTSDFTGYSPRDPWPEAGLLSADANTEALPSGCLLADRSATLDPGETCGDALPPVPKDAIRMPTAAARMPDNRPKEAPRYASLCDPWCQRAWADNAKPDADRCYPRSPAEARGRPWLLTAQRTNPGGRGHARSSLIAGVPWNFGGSASVSAEID